jgi:hypothetical protein
MNISLPKTLKDCTPEHLSKWVFLSGGEIDIETLSKSLDFQVQVVSIFSDISKPKLYNSDAKTINEAFFHLIQILSEPQQELVGEVTIKGQRYVFDKTFEHKTTGLIIDLKLIESVYDDPYRVLAMLYLEEGMKYNQVDDNDHLINPIENRIEAFKDEFPGDEFLNVFGFFLGRFQKLKDAIWGLNIAVTQMTMTKSKNELMKEIKMMNGSIGQRI